MIPKDVLEDKGLLSKCFKGYSCREGQLKMAEIIYQAYNKKQNVLINAPTGNGKTIGGLIPAILNKDKGQTVISTATKALQGQYINKDIPILHEAFKNTIYDFKSHVLKGRDNYICIKRFKKYTEEINQYTLDEDIKIYNDIIAPWILNTEYGDFEELDIQISYSLKQLICSNKDHCDDKCVENCFYTKNKTLAYEADIIIVNHDLFALDLMIKNKFNANILPHYYAAVIDEAHKFEDIVTKYIGDRFSKFAFKNYIASAFKYVGNLKYIQKDEIIKDLENKENTLMNYVTDFFNLFLLEEDNKVLRIKSDFIDDSISLEGKNVTIALHDFFRYIPKYDRLSCEKEIRDMYDNLEKRFRDLTEKIERLLFISKYEDEFVYWIEMNKHVFINWSPIEVGPFLSNWLFARHYEEIENGNFEASCVVLMSATLTTNRNFNFIKRRLGVKSKYEDIDEKCLVELIVSEVFDYKHQLLLHIPKGVLEPPSNGNNSGKQIYTMKVAQTLIDVARYVDGGIFLLSTSYSEMDKLYSITKDKVGNRNTYTQRMFPKQKLIDLFKQDGNAILYATSSFWEGISIEGSELSCILIDRIPFPVPSEPIIEARIDKMKINGSDWFNEYYLNMAILALQQGFGRLIRTNKDLGMVVLMDGRVLTKQYGNKILRSLPESLITRKIELVDFFFDIVRKKRKLRNR